MSASIATTSWPGVFSSWLHALSVPTATKTDPTNARPVAERESQTRGMVHTGLYGRCITDATLMGSTARHFGIEGSKYHDIVAANRAAIASGRRSFRGSPPPSRSTVAGSADPFHARVIAENAFFVASRYRPLERVRSLGWRWPRTPNKDVEIRANRSDIGSNIRTNQIGQCAQMIIECAPQRD